MTDTLFDNTQPVVSESAIPETVAPIDDDFERFRKNFHSLVQADPLLQNALNQNAQNTVELQRRRLKDEWGNEFDTLFAEVEQELQEIAKTNPQRAQALADADGAILIAQALKARKSQAAPVETGGLNRSTVPAYAQKEPLFTTSQIAKMTPAERRANHQAIAAAYAQNLVDRNA
jgi:hypothetical protein